MPIFIDPQTRQRVLYSKHTGDIVYDAQNAPAAVAEETVPVIGGFKDYTGSGGVPSRSQQMWAGHGNELQGTDAQIESRENLDQLGVVGQRTSTTRRRRRRIYKDLSNVK